jgi:hypothetical protein
VSKALYTSVLASQLVSFTPDLPSDTYPSYPHSTTRISAHLGIWTSSRVGVGITSPMLLAVHAGRSG